MSIRAAFQEVADFAEQRGRQGLADALRKEARKAEAAAYDRGRQSRQGEIDRLKATLAELIQAGRYITPYLTWTIGPESPGHHPTMPSACAAFAEALAKAKQEGGE